MQSTIRAVLIAGFAATVLCLQGADAPAAKPAPKVEAPAPLTGDQKAELWKMLAYLQLKQKAAEETAEAKQLKAASEEYGSKVQALQKAGFTIGPDTDFVYKPTPPQADPPKVPAH